MCCCGAAKRITDVVLWAQGHNSEVSATFCDIDFQTDNDTRADISTQVLAIP